MSEFGKRLKQIREMADLTQPQLAERSGVDQGQISRWERGEAPRVGQIAERFVRIADATSTPLRFLLVGEVAMPPRTAAQPWPNLSAAVAFARLCGISEDAIARATETARPGEDRSPRAWLRVIEAFEEPDLLTSPTRVSDEDRTRR